MRRPMPLDQREEYKQRWIAVIEAIMAAYRINASELARRLGVSSWTVYRWLDPSPSPKGTLPTGSASKLLTQMAEERGLIDRRGTASRAE